LLPELRGAAPINWAIVRGHDRTGVTIMRMVEATDAGPILYQVEEPIGGDETATDLWSRLSEISAEALIETLTLIEDGVCTEAPQNDAKATFAPRITRANARVNWSADAVGICNLIRGMDAVPGAWTTHRDGELKLFRPLPLPDHEHSEAAGTVIETHDGDSERGIVIACADGAVAVREVKAAGKRRMTASEFLRGRGMTVGDVLA
jgi:methionyl-tRNA formyltransferase